MPVPIVPSIVSSVVILEEAEAEAASRSVEGAVGDFFLCFVRDDVWQGPQVGPHVPVPRCRFPRPVLLPWKLPSEGLPFRGYSWGRGNRGVRSHEAVLGDLSFSGCRAMAVASAGPPLQRMLFLP